MHVVLHLPHHLHYWSNEQPLSFALFVEDELERRRLVSWPDSTAMAFCILSDAECVR